MFEDLHDAVVAVDLEEGTVGDAPRRARDADDGGDSQLTGDDDGVAS